MKSLLNKLARLILARPGAIWLGALALTALLAPGLTLIRITNDYSELLPEQSPSLKALHELGEKVEGLGEFVILLEGAPMDHLAAFAEEMIAHLGTDPLIRRARYRTNTDYFEKRKFLYMPLEDLRSLVKATKKKIRQEHLKESPFYVDLGVESEADRTLDEIKRKYDVDEYFSYFADDAREKLLLLLSPRAFPDDAAAASHLRDLADEASQKARARIGTDGIRVSYGGPYASLLYDHEILEGDTRGGAGLTVALIVLLLWLAYRSGWALLALLGPLSLAILWNFCLAGALQPQGLNNMSAFLGMILFGLGIDFSIHLLNRYGEERRGGRDLDEAIQIALTDTGESCVYAAATSAASFFMLVLAHFRGYTQFGVLAGVGVLLACAAILILLPSLIVILERRGHSGFVRERSRTRNLYHRIASFPLQHRESVLVVGVLITAWAAWNARELRINFDVSELRPRSEEIARVDQVSREVLDISSVPAVYTADGSDQVDDVIAAIKTTDGRLPQSVVLQIRSVRDLLPENEDEKRELLTDLDRALLRERKLADKPGDIQEIDDFRAEITMPPVRMAELPEEVLGEFRFSEHGYLIYLFADHNKVETESFPLFFSKTFGEVRGELADYQAAGPLMIEAEILTHLLGEGPRVMAAAMLLVALLVIVLLRTVRHSLLALLTLGIGFLWAAGAAAALGQRINVYNVVTLPAIIGLSIDYGIHVIHRYQLVGAGGLRSILQHTGTAVWMSALTTMAGFAGLLPSHHGGLRSLGVLAILGIFCGALAVVLFLPALAAGIERQEQQAAPPEAPPE